MSRPLRIEFPGALYHVTSRGDGCDAVYLDDSDRSSWLEVVGQVCQRFHWLVYAYCLMDDHYHLLLQTATGNLSAGMRQLNGLYTQRFNRRHGRAGHVFQGRYKSVLVDRDTHLLGLERHVVLNPVRSRLVDDAGDWHWSSYAATSGVAASPRWLAADSLLQQFHARRSAAIARYIEHVRSGMGLPSIWAHLNRQVFLGDDAFVARTQRKAMSSRRVAPEVPRAQRRTPGRPLDHYAALEVPRDVAMARAYRTGRFSLAEVAHAFDVHYSTVSRAVGRRPARASTKVS